MASLEKNLTFKFTPYSPTITSAEILVFESHLLEMLRKAPSSTHQTLCLSLGLVSAASHEFSCGKDSDNLSEKVSYGLLEYVVNG